MAFLDKYSAIVEQVEREMDIFLKEKINKNNKPILDEFYHLIKKHVFDGGKRLRPLCMIMAYRGYEDNYDIVPPSISPELVHSSSLILDDAMDEDVFRHGEPTFNALYADKFFEAMEFDIEKYKNGRYWIKRDTLKDLFFTQRAISRYSYALSVLGSNVMYAMSIEALSQCEFEHSLVLKALNLHVKMYQKLNEGQMLDILFESMNANEKEYISMIKRKTGILFIYPMRIGLNFANVKDINILDGYADSMSKAFQIHDDVLGSFGSEKLTGKPAHSDIKEGKRTLLVIKALENASKQQMLTLKKILGYEHASKEQIAEVRDIFIDTGAYDYCIKLSKEYVEKSKDALPNDMSDESYKFFSELADFIIHRKH